LDGFWEEAKLLSFEGQGVEVEEWDDGGDYLLLELWGTYDL
jgi:hypothetical protein